MSMLSLLIHYVYFTDLHACLLGDNTSVIINIRTITTESIGGWVRVDHWLRARDIDPSCLGFNLSSAIYLPAV